MSVSKVEQHDTHAFELYSILKSFVAEVCFKTFEFVWCYSDVSSGTSSFSYVPWMLSAKLCVPKLFRGMPRIRRCERYGAQIRLNLLNLTTSRDVCMEFSIILIFSKYCLCRFCCTLDMSLTILFVNNSKIIQVTRSDYFEELVMSLPSECSRKKLAPYLILFYSSLLN